jgi:hypothetical protein
LFRKIENVRMLQGKIITEGLVLEET